MEGQIVNVKRLHDKAKMPSKVHDNDACFDVYADDDFVLSNCCQTVVTTGLAFELPPGFRLDVKPRSGLAASYGATVINSPGTIDEGYRGELKVIMCLATGIVDEDEVVQEAAYRIKKGDRIAQIHLAEVVPTVFREVGSLGDSLRGENGLGSSGR